MKNIIKSLSRAELREITKNGLDANISHIISTVFCEQVLKEAAQDELDSRPDRSASSPEVPNGNQKLGRAPTSQFFPRLHLSFDTRKRLRK